MFPTYIAIKESVKEPTHAEVEDAQEQQEDNDGEEEAIDASLAYAQ